MSTEKSEELSKEQLVKKDKDATILITGIIIFYSLSLICLLVFMPIMAFIFIPLIFIVLPLVKGRKKIREELKKRGIINQI